MARKQKASVFNKFLDFIGIVDTAEDEQQTDGFEDDFESGRPGSSRNSARNSRFNDEFDNEPRMSRVQNKRPVSSADTSHTGSRFDADEGWGDSATRPEYGARTQQRAQSKTRPSTSRYGAEQRTSGRNSGRYENSTDQDAGHYRSGSSYQDYVSGSYRTGSPYGSSYGTASKRHESDSAYDGYATEQKEVETTSTQRHQTVIFKLHSVDECKGVIMALIEKKSVLLNLDELDSMQAQRTLDTMSGATFAIGARLSRASDRTWLITPSTVDVNDKQDDTADAGRTYSGKYY